MWILLILGICYVSAEEITLDAREGEDVTLECRFPPPSMQSLSYYWIRQSKTKGHDNVAIKDTPFDPNYKLNYHVEEGIYDLLISNASYDRDDGHFECKVKAGGSGQNIHTQSYAVTVLALPQPPQIAPGTLVTATEGKKQELTCSSVGGSPDPQVKWYREGSVYPLEAALKNGGSKDQPTTATLTLTPTKDDDDAIFRCEVWNRALSPDKVLTSSVSLSVQYFPRVSVGPENPLRVERDSSATLECSVDAKPKVTGVRWMRNSRFISPNYNHLIHRVSIQDAGKYTCSADNGLGKVGEREITLDVLFAPIVSLESKTKEAEEGESVFIKCNVTANPSPITIEWLKDGKPDFRQAGDTLRISHVTAENSGTYVCRAVNVLSPSGQGARRSERVGNASVALLVRHRPGRARISPSRPIVSEGGAVTLSCAATPPGWPAPQYKWLRTGSDGQTVILVTGTKYTIANANLAAEGTYNCQATNELGPGEMASVDLEVHQPPTFKHKLKPLETKRVGDPNFSVSCSARGKPRPIVKWLKDGDELTADANMFEVKTEYSESNNGAVNIHSTLKFSGKARPNGNELLPSDRGVYTCSFENEVRRTESTMHLKIEHEPIALHQYNKVAYDLSETAEVVCRVQAYPKPEFKWFFGNNINPLHSSSEGHYVVQITAEEDDMYTSVLKVSHIKKHDYGDYTCQVVNSLGRIDPKIRLQPKGPPEKPTKLVALYTGPTYVTLGWEPGFNGGIHNTKYFVSFKKVPGENDFMIEGCGPVSKNLDWAEVDCQQNVPCNVTHLDQHQTYLFKVKALNTKGIGENSQEIRATTRVDRIPVPQRVAYDKAANTLSINVPVTCLPLVAVVESISNDNHPITAWQVIDTLPLQVSGLVPTMKEKSLDKMMTRSFGTPMGRSLADEPIGMEEYSTPRVRVKLCLRTHHDHCGEFVEAELGYANSLREASALSTPTLIAIIVTCALFLISAGLLAVFCRCKRAQHSKKAQQTKDPEMDSVRPTIIPSNGSGQQNQAPPPYYAPGLDNQALDLQLVLDDQKAVYAATQNGYGHYGEPRNDWNYLDAGYTTAIPGNGSVDSQDSIWQLKMAANGGPQYDQYGGHDDYAHFPQTQDPYAQVHKPKKRLESPAVYRDAPGLPDPYMEQIDEDKPVPPPQHMSLAYEESLESGYSTPNSRTRRVIREIIV
ncbi:cell adhesion molecule DSCAM-like isoform X2 [Anthonomus grandis grandis]|uniref:cell adhesion molecule DSCAM-like isoform X2 n=1 Tax=Anthonomus grandis grandis TaxID=2921223 RepID=UPI0021659BC3|nr:cell adhesion molecule DSCAM-like isoform X2 [Anthonomus grandis grandis]